VENFRLLYADYGAYFFVICTIRYILFVIRDPATLKAPTNHFED